MDNDTRLAMLLLGGVVATASALASVQRELAELENAAMAMPTPGTLPVIGDPWGGQPRSCAVSAKGPYSKVGPKEFFGTWARAIEYLRKQAYFVTDATGVISSGGVDYVFEPGKPVYARGIIL